MQMYQTLGITRQDTDKRLLQWEQNYSAFGAPVVLFFFTNQMLEKVHILIAECFAISNVNGC